MPIKKAAMKALRQAKKRTLRNAKVREGIAFLRRSVRKALESSNVKDAQETARALVKKIDKAVQNKVLKRNTASRLKSRLAKKINAVVKAAKK
ncbi:MAG TPA: 30S ribosomal protein S20 [Candidatus Binatia bacterium]|jgi:small subunit ribosomal protein S20|nr:30S ribosomal protein S20 [Candidatus Binatia bacterium]